MDYLQIYNDQFDATWAQIKSKTIDDFKTARKNKKNFNTLFNNIISNLYAEQEKIIEYFNNHTLNSCYKLFEKRHSLYDANLEQQEVISLILQNEVIEEHLSLEKSNYENFIKKIGKHQAISKIGNHLGNYYEYYKLIYNQDKYENFYAKDFEDIGFENSSEYIEMLNEEYPNRAKESVKLIGTHTTEGYLNNEKNIAEMNKEDIRYQAKIASFSTKQKHFLLAVLFDSIGSNNEDKGKYGVLPLSEYVRIIAIVKDIMPLEVFYKSIANISIYTELKKKQKLVKKNEKDIFINELNNKLNDLNIITFQKFFNAFLR